MNVLRLCWQLLASRGLVPKFPVAGDSLKGGLHPQLVAYLNPCKTPAHQKAESKEMSLSSSSSAKALESPFSHKEVYGVEHTFAVKVRRKSKVKHRKSSKSETTVSAKTSGRIRSLSGSGPPRRKSKTKEDKRPTATPVDVGGASKSAPTGKSRMVVSHVGSASSRDDSLAIVEADSPNALRQRRRDSRGWPLAGSKSSDFINGAWRKGERIIGKYSAGGGVPTSVSAHTASGKPRFSRSVPSVSSAVSRLSLTDSEEKLKAGLLSSAVNIRFNRTLTNRNIPPHLRVPRRAFESSADQVAGRGGGRGRSQPGVLSITDVARGLARRQYQRVVVMSGAGISTSSGIPDFRTPGTGLYDNLQQYKIPDPTSIFDITFFAHNPRPFFTLAKELYPGQYSPNPVHYFVRLLQDRGLLLRNYTQNIDGLERMAGVSPGKLVEAHGSFSTASCTRCRSHQDPVEVKEAIFAGKVPRCRHKYCLGVVKPDIVFFGEDLPERFYSLRLPDFSRCDLLIVMGTSLEVEPFASLATLTRMTVPRVLINRELVGPFKSRRQRPTDVAVTGDLVQCVRDLVDETGWLRELEALCGEEEEEEGEEEEEEEGEEEGEGSSAGTSKEATSHEGPVERVFDGGSTVGRTAPSEQEKDICSAMLVLSLSESPKSAHLDDGESTREEVEGDEWSLEDIFSDLKKSSK